MKKNKAFSLILQRYIIEIIGKMNKRSATVRDDIPMNVVSLCSEALSSPLTHIINSIFETSSYPKLWKTEVITPIQKFYPAETLKSLRPISQILVFAKVFDRILAEYLTEDMAERSDPQQYGNQKGLSINHYLINLLHRILTGLDKNSASEKRQLS